MKSGILAVHKPEGISSAQVVSRVKRVLRGKKVGHTGTLDPFATGLILCAVNKGTRISRFFLDGKKRYAAKIFLGAETDTYDRTGQVVSRAGHAALTRLKPEDIRDAVASFKGIQQQVPPVFSALKHKGQPLYKLARQGIEIKKPARTIEVFDIRITGMALPCLDLDILCSSGTYIRSIAFDIGRTLGCGAYLTELCRTQSSHFTLDSAIGLDRLEILDKKAALDRIVPLSEALAFLPQLVMDTPLVEKIKFGQRLSAVQLGLTGENAEPGAMIKLVDSTNNLLAIVAYNAEMQRYNYTCVFLS